MARVSSDLVVVEDTLYVSEQVEEAEQLRPRPRALAEERVARLPRDGRPRDRTGRVLRAATRWTSGSRARVREDDAARVKELLADQIEGDEYVDRSCLFKARKTGAVR